MAYTYDELKHKTVAELRDIAAGLQHEAVQGYTQMNKEHLLPAVCKALGIDTHEHHAAAVAEKSKVKARMHAIRAALSNSGGDREKLHALRREYHHLNHRLRVDARHAAPR
jgi:hypothetical protein